jgi:WhiB family transcriptional regulator, redox-sensing transcriptional regulator
MAGHALEYQIAGSGPPPVLGPSTQYWLAASSAVRSPGWMSRGACRGEDPELFFPVAAAGPALVQASLAKAVCGRCPVQPDSLSYALVTGQHDGIWGGTTTEERWPARRLRSDPPAEPGRLR